jgi:hypothetical protein
VAREDVLARTLIQLADTMGEDFDLLDILVLLVDRCVELLGISAAGVMLVAPEGGMRLAAASNDEARVLELLEIQAQQGPCLDSFRSGAAIVNANLRTADQRWPSFSPVAIAAGFRTVHAFPMRWREVALGAVNLFDTSSRALTDPDLLAGQALADMASLTILQYRAISDVRSSNENLSRTLGNRLQIEQAKGVLAERTGIEMEEAFAAMRNHARNHNLRLVEVAARIIDGSLSDAALDQPSSRRDE